MSTKQVKDWFTVNGQHIPIFEGESKSQAVNRYIAEKNEETKSKQISENKKQADNLNKKENKKENKRAYTIAERKKAQLEIVKKYNPKNPDRNQQATWVESVDDIQTWEEAMNDEWSYKDSDVTPDFTLADIKKAQKEGYVTVYSSKPIKQGSFVTPSKMIAVNYGNKNPYTKRVKLTDVAWIDLQIRSTIFSVLFNPK